MSSNITKYPLVRRSFIVLSFVGLVGLFFALNYLLFIPRQQQLYNKKIFRVLQEVSDDFKRTLDGSADYYAKNINPDSSGEKLVLSEADVNKGNFKHKLASSFQAFNTAIDKSRKYKRNYIFGTDTIRLLIVDTSKNTSDTVKKEIILISQLLEPNIKNLHHDLFDLIMLVKRDTISFASKEEKKIKIRDKVLYKFGELAAEYILPGDSLFRDNRFGQFSAISDILIEGSSYKTFALPFQFYGEELIFLGFLEERDYKIATSRYSNPSLICIGSLLMLVILMLPFIKIFGASRQERIAANDIRMLMVVLVAAPFLMIIAVSTVQIYQFADQETDDELHSLQTSVKKKFKEEIDSAISQLKHYDYLVECADSALFKTYNQYKEVIEKRKDSTLKDFFFFPKVYKNVDDIFWVNDDGVQIAKWFFLQKGVSYLDVSERSFFQNMRDNRAFISKDDTFYIEPAISWATGDYSVNILTKSHQSFEKSHNAEDMSKQAIMIGMAARMYSVCNPVVPKGYNFCIIDDDGRILFHSETERSLHENLFDESNRNFELMNAVSKKDSILIPDVQLFEQDVKMMVTSIEGLPSFHVVSYFNKREQNLFVFHISSFTFLCTSLALISLLLFLLLIYMLVRKTSALNFYIYESAWVKPSEKKKEFYQQILLQQLSIVVLAILFFLLASIADATKQLFILQLSFLLPFFIANSYYLIKNEYNKKEDKLPFFEINSRIITFYFFIMLCLLLSIYNLLYEKIHLQYADYFIIAFVILVPFLARYSGFFQKKLARFLPAHYLDNYTVLIFLCIFLISVVPAFGFLSYALKKETQTQIKARQFYAAKKIETRRDELNRYIKTTKLRNLSDSDKNIQQYIINRKLSSDYGIYLTHYDTLVTVADPAPSSKDSLENSHLYQVITRFLFLPKDHADFFDNNNFYSWFKDAMDEKDENKIEEKAGISLIYKNDTDHETRESVKITSRLKSNPVLYSMITTYSGWLIIVCTPTFFVLLCMLIKSIAKKIFLLDYFDYDKTSKSERNWAEQFYKKILLSKEEKQFFGIRKKFLCIGNEPLTNQIILSKEHECKIDSQEGAEQILRIQHLLTPGYNAIWEGLKSDEKFLLYDFALDGYTNYKNVDILYRLYQKGLIRKEKKECQLELMNYSFRNYLLGKAGTEEIVHLEQELSFASNWKTMKNIFYALFFAVMIFLFTTQQEVSNKILAIISGIVTLIPLLLKLFDKNITDGGSLSKKGP